MLEAIASSCELLEGILQYHYGLPTLEGLIHEIINGNVGGSVGVYVWFPEFSA